MARMSDCSSGICSSADLAAELGESVQTIANLIYQTPGLREQTAIVGGRRVVPRTLIPAIEAALIARRGKKMIKAPLSTWTGSPVEGEFTPRHLALATQYMREHVGCSFEAAAEFAREQFGKEPGASEPLTAAQAAAVMHRLAARPDTTLDHAIHFARRAGTDTERGLQGGNPDHPKPELDKDGLKEGVIYGRETMRTSEEREREAREFEARQTKLRKAWENLVETSREIGFDPPRASEAMKFLNIPGGKEWEECLKALDNDDEMSREEMSEALNIMRHSPRMSWAEAFHRVKGRYPD
jgi:hypothetical protein